MRSSPQLWCGHNHHHMRYILMYWLRLTGDRSIFCPHGARWRRSMDRAIENQSNSLRFQSPRRNSLSRASSVPTHSVIIIPAWWSITNRIVVVVVVVVIGECAKLKYIEWAASSRVRVKDMWCDVVEMLARSINSGVIMGNWRKLHKEEEGKKGVCLLRKLNYKTTGFSCPK